MEDELLVKYQLLEDLGKGKHARIKKLVSQLWTIEANNRRGHASNSCLNVLRNTLP